MASINFTVPDNKVSEIQDAFADVYKYAKNQLPGETKTQFLKRQIAAFVNRTLKESKIRTAVLVARDREIANPDVEIT